jgi:hypothetical protein
MKRNRRSAAYFEALQNALDYCQQTRKELKHLCSNPILDCESTVEYIGRCVNYLGLKHKMNLFE